jgi:hypothetical protein
MWQDESWAADTGSDAGRVPAESSGTFTAQRPRTAVVTQRRLISAHWTDADLEKLAALIRAGATASRCAVVFKRRVDAVKTKARQLGIPFPSERKTRKALRDKMASKK